MNNMQSEKTRFEIEKKIMSSVEDFDLLKGIMNEYRSVFGSTPFYCLMYNYILKKNIPQIACVIRENENEKFDSSFLKNQIFQGVDKIIVSDSDSWKEISEFIISSGYNYFFFYEGKYEYECDFLINGLYEIDLHKADGCILGRKIVFEVNGEKCIQTDTQMTMFSNRTYLGDEISAISKKNNIMGSIGQAVFSKSSIIDKSLDDDICDVFSEKVIRNLYCDIIKDKSIFVSQGVEVTFDIRNSVYDTNIYSSNRKSGISKHITFFYTDKGEYFNLKPIASEAEKRGYVVEFTTELKKKAEIGVYCQHVCFPENSKYSLILLHDMAQGHNRWPNLWELEPWNIFDLGILPGDFWSTLWEKSSIHPYVNPKDGCFAMGYPKSDEVSALQNEEQRNRERKALGFKYEKTILYAPSWENDEKEDDFIRALVSLPVNLLIKQAQWPDKYQFVIESIDRMRQLHEGKFDNVHYLEPTESILKAINLCDLIVSDESSVMTEGILMHKPSIAVCDWLIPDTVPARFASTPFDYVVKCKKVELREYVQRFIAGDDVFEQSIERGQYFYNNVGNCSKDIVDAIDYFTQRGLNDSFMRWKLKNPFGNFLLYN